VTAVQAVIFDMDGVLTDSEPRHFRALNRLLSHFGMALTAEHYASLTGHSGLYTWRWLSENFGITGTFEEWRERYDPIIVSLLAEPAETLPGVRELMAEIRRRDLRMGVASTSRTSWVAAALGSLGISDCFDAVVSGDMVEHGKPAPDIYLLAAAQLAVVPASCLVIEDSAPGVESAKAAGMFVVQLRATPQAAPPLALADLVIEDLREFPLSLLPALKPSSP
jgi:HAD superfamily hydrolase (TIGR01509 family)